MPLLPLNWHLSVMLEHKYRIMPSNVKKSLILYFGKLTRDYKKGFFSLLCYSCFYYIWRDNLDKYGRPIAKPFLVAVHNQAWVL